MAPFAASMHLQFVTAPARQLVLLAKQAGNAIGQFFYGTDIRTKRTITFSYLCISLYLLAVINADHFNACTR